MTAWMCRLRLVLLNLIITLRLLTTNHQDLGELGTSVSYLTTMFAVDDKAGGKVDSNMLSSPRHTLDSDSFSACMIFKDDNHRLIEWIAYHYYAMNLRFLVIALDPYSKTSPQPVIDRWKNRMTIHIWNDKDYLPRNIARKNKREEYLERQQSFNRKCAVFSMQQNRTWTTFYDVDEYVVANEHVLGANLSKGLVGQPGYISTMLRDVQNNSYVKPQGHYGDEAHEHWLDHFDATPCFILPRTVYGATESNHSQVMAGVPSLLTEVAVHLDTMRYRYRSMRRDGGQTDGPGKSVMDVSRLTSDALNGVTRVHRVFSAICRDSWVNYNRVPMALHHYLGSFEAYSYRSDARGPGHTSREAWLSRFAGRDDGADDEVRPWLQGFVNLVGADEAFKLLQGAGIPGSTTMNATDPSGSPVNAQAA
jgi:hypothetical protein